MGAGDGEAEFQVGGAADIDVQLGRDLRRHALRYDASGVIAGRQQLEGEIAFRIAGRGVARAGRGVHHDDRSLSNAAAGGIEHGAADCSGSVLGREGCGHCAQKEDESWKRNNARRRHKVASECEIKLGGTARRALTGREAGSPRRSAGGRILGGRGRKASPRNMEKPSSV